MSRMRNTWSAGPSGKTLLILSAGNRVYTQFRGCDMKKLTILFLLALISGCTATGNSCGCACPGECSEAKQQIMYDAVHYRAFGP